MIGWKPIPLGDLLDVQNGYAFSSEEFSDQEGVPLIRIRDLKANSSPAVRFSGSFDKRYLVNDGDLLIGMDGEFACYEWGGGSALLNQRVCRLVDFSDGIEPRFLLYGINKFLKEIEGETTYTTVKHLSSKTVKEIRFPLPSPDEQKRIVALLDQAFAALDRARANAEANLADADAVFERTLLTTFDELMPNAMMKPLAHAATDFSRGKSRHRPRNDPNLYDGDYPFIQTGDVRKARGAIREFSQTYNERGLAQSKLWPVGTVCITIAANIAETGVLEMEACFPDSVIGMVPSPKEATPYYVEYMLRYFSKELKLKGKGSAQDNINLATFEHSMFPFPVLAQQNAIVEKLNTLSESVSTLRNSYARTLDDVTFLRQSLLQAAFSGRLT